MNNDYIGQKFNSLTVIDDYSNDGRRMFVCRCECGNTKTIRADSVLYGKTKSCGCANHRPYRFRNLSRTDYKKIFDAWKRMIYRCYNPKHHKFPIYGARGISVCDEWLDKPDNFIQWSLDNGYNKELTLDRINVDGNYEPSNCRWATKSQQQRNRRITKYLEYNGESKPVAEWCEIFNLPYDTTKERLNHGWSFEKCLSTPIKSRKS